VGVLFSSSADSVETRGAPFSSIVSLFSCLSFGVHYKSLQSALQRPVSLSHNWSLKATPTPAFIPRKTRGERHPPQQRGRWIGEATECDTPTRKMKPMALARHLAKEKNGPPHQALSRAIRQHDRHPFKPLPARSIQSRCRYSTAARPQDAANSFAMNDPARPP